MIYDLFMAEMIWDRCKVPQKTELHQHEVDSKCALFSLEYLCLRSSFSHQYFHIKYTLQEEEVTWVLAPC